MPEPTKLPSHLVEASAGWCDGFGPAERQQVDQLLLRHADVLSEVDMDVGRTTVVKHSIPIVDGAAPIKQRGYRHGPVQEAEIQCQVQELLDKDLIEEGKGAWSAPVVLVKKKDGKWKFCVDYRKLNEITQRDVYPLPRIDETLDALGGYKLFSTLDLTTGY